VTELLIHREEPTGLHDINRDNKQINYNIYCYTIIPVVIPTKFALVVVTVGNLKFDYLEGQTTLYMKVLLDTNIIIHREASTIINRDIGVLFNWLDRLHYTKCVHPLTVSELSRHLDPRIVNTMQAKLASYYVLKTEAPLHDEVSKVAGQIDTTPNDADDTKLINEAYSNRVDLLISEDKKVHTKAKMLGIDDRVFRIDSFLEKVLAENPELVDYKVLAIRKQHFGDIHLNDTFFDSFREDYVGFDKWFNKKADEVAYVCYDNGMLSAFLFVKPEEQGEDYNNIDPVFSRMKRLKIGTLKVSSNGFKLGERFLKIVFDNARQFKVDEVYVTIFDKRPEQLRLIALLEDYGFTYYGTKKTESGAEKIFVKNLKVEADQLHPKLTFPKISRNAGVFIIPIQPNYHTELFPDSILRTESPLDFVENQPHRNAISKVYVSHSLNRNLNSGNAIVFYRSGGNWFKGVATTIGIVENIVDGIKDLDELIHICRKRTVLTDKELKEYWDWKPKNRPFVINFLYAYSFKRRMNLKAMLEEKILSSMDNVRTITPIPMESFIHLINLSGI
jgi:predicted nucleic acid-binding protein